MTKLLIVLGVLALLAGLAFLFALLTQFVLGLFGLHVSLLAAWLVNVFIGFVGNTFRRKPE